MVSGFRYELSNDLLASKESTIERVKGSGCYPGGTTLHIDIALQTDTHTHTHTHQVGIKLNIIM